MKKLSSNLEGESTWFPERTGYNFLGWIDTEGNEILNISTTDLGDKELTATWSASQGGEVIIKYVKELGQDISRNDVLQGEFDEKYTTNLKSIQNYTLITTPVNSSGKFTTEIQTVTYMYEVN